MLLSEIIGKDINLKKLDHNRYEALCPWHKDTVPSLKVHNGKNFFKCFVCGEGGHGAIAWLMKTRDCSYSIAVDLLKIDYNSVDFETYNIEEKQVEYLLPLDRFKKPTFEHYIWGYPTNIYTYKNLENRLLGYTCRYKTPKGKVVLPYNYIMINGSPEWVFHGFKVPILPYKAELLTIHPKAVVCIVEGEKTADCGNKNSKTMIFLSWVGGAEATNQTDWNILKGRHVILLPDHDKLAKDKDGNLLSIRERPGNKAMLNIAVKIQRIASKIEFVVISEDYENKWDIAEREDWKPGDLNYWINKNKINYFKFKL